jgi:hypothetical protein
MSIGIGIGIGVPLPPAVVLPPAPWLRRPLARPVSSPARHAPALRAFILAPFVAGLARRVGNNAGAGLVPAAGRFPPKG